jgi:hypothetical protein
MRCIVSPQILFFLFGDGVDLQPIKSLASSCCYAVVQVSVQTRPGFAKGLTDGMPKLIQAEGAGA